jgi:cell division septation protein DedD
MAYDFSLDRKAAITLSTGSVLLLVLVFAAGVLTGVSWRSARELMVLNRPVKPPQKAADAALPGAPPPEKGGKDSAAESAAAPDSSGAAAPDAGQQSPAASATTASTATTPAASAPAGAAAKGPSDATSAPAAAELATRVPPYSGVQLAVQVGSFLEKSNAEKLAEELKAEGYAPQIIVGGHAPKQWNIVRVGPYRDWDEASEIAAVLSRDRSTPAVIRPMR